MNISYIFIVFYTHVHRISNFLEFIETKNLHQTELELMKIVPKKYWSRINRIFVLWGKDVPGRDKKKLLRKLKTLSIIVRKLIIQILKMTVM